MVVYMKQMNTSASRSRDEAACALVDVAAMPKDVTDDDAKTYLRVISTSYNFV